MEALIFINVLLASAIIFCFIGILRTNLIHRVSKRRVAEIHDALVREIYASTGQFPDSIQTWDANYNLDEAYSHKNVFNLFKYKYEHFYPNPVVIVY